jgi:hypothetical protein
MTLFRMRALAQSFESAGYTLRRPILGSPVQSVQGSRGARGRLW